jgi:hypothetical protein
VAERLISFFGDALWVLPGRPPAEEVSPGASVISGSVAAEVLEGVGR